MHERTSVGNLTSENGSDSSPDGNGAIEELAEDTILSQQTPVNLVPFIGQRFVSQEAAYEFYCSFAKQFGFSIRRHRTRGKDGVGRGVTRRDFTCHRSGYPQLKQLDDAKPQSKRKSSRCGCRAYMRIVKKTAFDVLEWRVTGFSNVHNHELMNPDEVRPLPGCCMMTADDKSRVCLYAKAGMSARQMLRLMELEKGVKLGCLPFMEADIRNLMQSFRKVDRDNDPMDLLKLCKDKKDKDPCFKYDYKIDSNNRLEHIAWSYGSSIRLYEMFGDAIVFDASHRLDVYDMMFGVWIGVDNYGGNTCFGCVLLRDENVQSFCWALKTFLNVMKGKAPTTILTNQNMWLKEAISAEMPSTKHACSIYHIISKFSSWFSELLGSQYSTWKTEFHRLYNLHSVQEFELGWREMVDTYGLRGNKHIISLYELRAYWALPFLRSYFFAGITSTLRLESINVYIERLLSLQFVMDDFVEQVAMVLDARNQAGSRETMQPSAKITLKTGSPIESHAAALLTPYAFCKLQDELLLALQYASLMMGEETCFIVRHHAETDEGCKVLWVPHDELIECSCRQFEFSGILCRHVLRVLSTNNCFHVPERYLPTRWRISVPASSGKVQLLQSMISLLVTESIETRERLNAACDHVALVLARIREYPAPSDGGRVIGPAGPVLFPEVEDYDSIAARGCVVNDTYESVALAKLKGRVSGDGLDMHRKRRCTCTLNCMVPGCGQFGHDAGTCPIMGDDDLSADGFGFL